LLQRLELVATTPTIGSSTPYGPGRSTMPGRSATCCTPASGPGPIWNPVGDGYAARVPAVDDPQWRSTCRPFAAAADERCVELEQPGARMFLDTVGDGGLDVGDCRLQRAEHSDVGVDDGAQCFLGQTTRCDRSAAQPSRQLHGWFAAAIGVPPAERRHPGFTKMTGHAWGRVVSKERHPASL
jgi:hypothetical protein